MLYVVDSVTRSWVDQAKKSGQAAGSGGPDGTYAAGVARVTELLPVLMNDTINSAPEDQKVRIECLCKSQTSYPESTTRYWPPALSHLGRSGCYLEHELTAFFT